MCLTWTSTRGPLPKSLMLLCNPQGTIYHGSLRMMLPLIPSKGTQTKRAAASVRSPPLKAAAITRREVQGRKFVAPSCVGYYGDQSGG